MRISFLLLLLHTLFFSQIAFAVDDVELKSALLKAIKTHDTAAVKAIADGGYESIDRDDVLQEKIYYYLEAEEERIRLAKEQAKADKLAQEQAKKKAAAAAAAAQKAAEEKAKADALAKQRAQQKAKADALAKQKAAERKARADALAAKKAAEEEKRKKALAAEKEKARKAAAEQKRKEAAAKQAAAAKPVPKPVVKTVPKPVVAPVVAAPAAAAAAAEKKEEPVIVSDKKLIGTWKQVTSAKVITFAINQDASFNLEEVEEDGTLTLLGTWKSDKNIFMLSIKKVQRNVHSRRTDIHRIYKIKILSKHRLVLRDQRNRIAYDLQR